VLRNQEDHVPGVRVIEVAQQANGEPWNSRRIVKIVLFGSVLTGKDTDGAGDVDLDVTIRVRDCLPENSIGCHAFQTAPAPFPSRENGQNTLKGL
jgi:hypothetical protein